MVWALVADRALTGGNSSGFASCHAGMSGRFDAGVRSGQDSLRLGGSTVPAPSRVCWEVEQQRSIGRKHGQLSGLSGFLCFGGLEFWNRFEEVMVLDCRCLASRSDLRSGLGSSHCLAGSSVRSVRWEPMSAIQSVWSRLNQCCYHILLTLNWYRSSRPLNQGSSSQLTESQLMSFLTATSIWSTYCAVADVGAIVRSLGFFSSGSRS